MEKTVGAFDARRNFGKMLQEILSKGDRFVVERHGEPVAAVVPIEVYRQWKKSREAFFDRVRAASEMANLSPDEAEDLAEEAVSAAREASRTGG